MKYIAPFLFFICLFASCEKEIVVSRETDSNINTVTFKLSSIESSFTSNVTKAAANSVVNLSEYDVMFYLFKQTDLGYQLTVKKPVTEILFKIEVEKEKNYKYVIAATKKRAGTGINPLIVAKDYFQGYSGEVEATVESASLLSNCFFDICGTGSLAFGGGEEVSINENPEIYAGGFDLSTSYTFHTPVDIVLKRQIGAVEFRLTGLTPGTQHTFKCSVPSDYYRLYLSQIVRVDVNHDFDSQNKGVNEDTGIIDGGDYYGNVSGVSDFLYFTKEETLTVTSDKYNFYIYMPYTIASENTITNGLYSEGNANYSENIGQGTLTLTIDNTQNYTYSKAFPIYRNKKSYFLLKGENELECKLGNIALDDDEWNGNIIK